MLELSSTRKNKVTLSDYNCRQDIENRSLLANLSFFEHEVLQEIFFSPTKFPLKKLARNLGCEEDSLSPILEKLSRSGLLSIQEDMIFIDKEMRKYFEFHMKRFDSDFKPDMEYLQGILRKVPIHLLPSWYAIPRTSNNIFESIVDKYLLTPQYFHRYVSELNFTNPLAHQIMRDVFSSADYRIPANDLIAKYNLSRPEFEEILLMLEFSFVCCVTYTKDTNLWIEWVSPFHEWHEYLKFFKTTDALSIAEEKKIIRKRKNDYAFVEDLGALLLLSQKINIPSPLDRVALEQIASSLCLEDLEYVSLLINKLEILQLVESKDGKLLATEASSHFLNMNPEKRALYLYKNPLNRILNSALPQEIATEKNIREAEKSIRRALKKGWVLFDDFIKGAIVCLNDSNHVSLKRIGKIWKYVIPTYTDKECLFIKIVILEWLFEAGMICPGTYEGNDCFTVTPFGRFFFEE